MILGSKIYLRNLTRADATPAYVGWLNDPETTRYLESGRRVETIESIADYISRYEGRDDAVFMAIMLREGDVHVGNVKLEPIDRVNNHAVLGIMIGDPSARGRGIGFDVMITTLRYAFDELGLHRVALGVRSDNTAAIRCYEKVGLNVEGRLRDSIRQDGSYTDSLLMGMLDYEFHAKYG